MNTKLYYLDHQNSYALEGIISALRSVDGIDYLETAETVFYPGGGGQPCDTGTITGPNGHMIIEKVTFDPERACVIHIGHITGNLEPGETVTMHIDPKQRSLHSGLHTKGHLIDVALGRIGITMGPIKGYHFPAGPYVEYRTNGPIETQTLAQNIEQAAQQLIDENHPVTVRYESGHVNGKPMRVVSFAGVDIPCGGTHVSTLSELVSLTIRKIKIEKDVVRISYQ